MYIYIDVYICTSDITTRAACSLQVCVYVPFTSMCIHLPIYNVTTTAPTTVPSKSPDMYHLQVSVYISDVTTPADATVPSSVQAVFDTPLQLCVYVPQTSMCVHVCVHVCISDVTTRAPATVHPKYVYVYHRQVCVYMYLYQTLLPELPRLFPPSICECTTYKYVYTYTCIRH